MQTYALDEAHTEVIFAPFHDPVLSPTLAISLSAQGASNCRYEHFWDATHVFWDACPVGEKACTIELEASLSNSRYDQFLFCVTFAEAIRLNFEACVDGRWTQLAANVTGHRTRQEIRAPIPSGKISAVRMQCFAVDGMAAVVRIHWFGLANTQLQQLMQSRPGPCEDNWAGMFRDECNWGSQHFYRGLLFGESELNELRRKRDLPRWKEHFAVLVERATSYLQRRPEDNLGHYLPWSDERYIRERERGRSTYFWQPLTLALVGLVNEDARLIRHALRYLMCLVHTTHWCQSAESRAAGSTWNQRCFLEEMACTSVALLADWLDFALTDQARALIQRALWEKGLAVIERDMMACEEVHHINQGVWFCRGRILAGLILEKAWPHVGDFVDRACQDLRNVLERYIKSDGGVEEGTGYFCLTSSFALQGLTAYARSRQLDVSSLLPGSFALTEHYLATMSAVRPGRLLMAGDNSTDRMPFDAAAILAALYPQSAFASVLAATLLPDAKEFTYFDHYDAGGVFGFIMGPADVAPARPIVSEFRNLQYCGQMTSFRRDSNRSLRIHFSGACARPSHAHFDRGSFTIEANGEPILIDRGIVRYDHPACFTLKRTCLHNTITPVMADGSFPDQANCELAVVPLGHGDGSEFRARMDISHVWRNFMSRCCRTINSPNCREMSILDEGTLHDRGRIAFHLHSLLPFVTDNGSVLFGSDAARFRLTAEWCDEIRYFEDSIDYRMQPVFHLVCVSRPLVDFAIETTLRRI